MLVINTNMNVGNASELKGSGAEGARNSVIQTLLLGLETLAQNDAFGCSQKFSGDQTKAPKHCNSNELKWASERSPVYSNSSSSEGLDLVADRGGFGRKRRGNFQPQASLAPADSSSNSSTLHSPMFCREFKSLKISSSENISCDPNHHNTNINHINNTGGGFDDDDGCIAFDDLLMMSPGTEDGSSGGSCSSGSNPFDAGVDNVDSKLLQGGSVISNNHHQNNTQLLQSSMILDRKMFRQPASSRLLKKSHFHSSNSSSSVMVSTQQLVSFVNPNDSPPSAQSSHLNISNHLSSELLEQEVSILMRDFPNIPGSFDLCAGKDLFEGKICSLLDKVAKFHSFDIILKEDFRIWVETKVLHWLHCISSRTCFKLETRGFFFSCMGSLAKLSRTGPKIVSSEAMNLVKSLTVWFLHGSLEEFHENSKHFKKSRLMEHYEVIIRIMSYLRAISNNTGWDIKSGNSGNGMYCETLMNSVSHHSSAFEELQNISLELGLCLFEHIALQVKSGKAGSVTTKSSHFLFQWIIFACKYVFKVSQLLGFRKDDEDRIKNILSQHDKQVE